MGLFGSAPAPVLPPTPSPTPTANSPVGSPSTYAKSSAPSFLAAAVLPTQGQAAAGKTLLGQ